MCSGRNDARRQRVREPERQHVEELSILFVNDLLGRTSESGGQTLLWAVVDSSCGTWRSDSGDEEADPDGDKRLATHVRSCGRATCTKQHGKEHFSK